MKPRPRLSASFGCLLTLIFVLSVSASLAGERTQRVLILPFDIHSEKDLSFLNEGIIDMLASRIGQSAQVIRHPAPVPGNDSVRLGHETKADYLVTGSLTFFGQDVSTDAALTRVDTGESVLRFSRLAQNGGEILKNIDGFATQVSQYLASLPDGSTISAAPGASAPAVVPVPTAKPAGPQAPAAPATKNTVEAATATAAMVDKPPADQTLWVSGPFKGTISALAAADVTGDGITEIVVAHEKKIVVQSRDGQRLKQLAVFDAGSRHAVISVDAGDMNGNRKAEIYVTRLNAQKNLDTVVLEWNGARLAPVATGQRWYFRILTGPEKGPLLVGQRRGTPSDNDTGGLYDFPHFMPGVFEMTWTGETYRAGRRLPIPNDLNVYRFTRGDIFNDGARRTIAYSASDELRVFDPAGAPQWAGKETFGGNPAYLEAPSLTDSHSMDRTYLTQRLMVADIDDDGKMEIVTAHNHDATKGFMERYRKYNRGRMIALRWNEVNMKTIWSGEEVGGYISDFYLADLNGDGKLEAIYAMVTSTGLTQAKSSHIVVERIGRLTDGP